MQAQDIQIGHFTLGASHPPFVVAELSGNHNNSLERALAIVDAAAAAGAHALKLQTYTADSMTLNLSEGPYVVSDRKSLWYGRSLYELYQEAATPYEWHQPLMKRCHELGMVCFSTPFDETAVTFLESLDVPCYKIASFENTDLPLIKQVAATGKPLIISTGMASLDEISMAVETARGAGAKDIILLKCTSAYPATPAEANIVGIPHLRDTFSVQVGLSDHTMGIGVAVASIALGSVFIEKHFTLSRADGGVDSAFSLEPAELKSLVTETRTAWESLGQITYSGSKSEQASKIFRRSLIIASDMRQGETFNTTNLRRLRPGVGLPCSYFDEVLGSAAKTDFKAGTPLALGMWES